MEVARTCAPCRDETVAVPASLTCEFVGVVAASLVVVPWLAAPSVVSLAVWVAELEFPVLEDEPLTPVLGLEEFPAAGFFPGLDEETALVFSELLEPDEELVGPFPLEEVLPAPIDDCDELVCPELLLLDGEVVELFWEALDDELFPAAVSLSWAA